MDESISSEALWKYKKNIWKPKSSTKNHGMDIGQSGLYNRYLMVIKMRKREM